MEIRTFAWEDYCKLTNWKKGVAAPVAANLRNFSCFFYFNKTVYEI